MLKGQTLAIDIGGTGIKALVLNAHGHPVNERVRIETPRPATPEAVLGVIREILQSQPPFERVSVGFPGVVVTGQVKTAPNLDGEWAGVHLDRRIEHLAGHPTKVINDADLQGFGAIEGHGVEMILTLGTGLGSGLYVDGVLVPNLELGHHPLRGKHTYETYVRDKALKKIGKKEWNRRVREIIAQVLPIWNPRRLYLGGGNARHVKLTPELPPEVRIVDNSVALLAGVKLWRGH